MEYVPLSSSISHLSGVGTMRAEQLRELGIETLRDLLYHVPFRYETIEQSIQIADLKADTNANFRARVVSKIPIQTRRFRSMIKVKASDDTGSIELTWFNTPFILSSLSVGQEYYFTGKVSAFKNKLTITNPTVDVHAPDFGSLIPIYHESVDINSRLLRKLIKEALEIADLQDDPAMSEAYQRHSFIPLREALRVLHQPKVESQELLTQAKKRLAFDEMFFLILEVMKRRSEHMLSKSVGKLTTTNDDIKQFAKLLPYDLTSTQREAIQAISLDLIQEHPMQRLVQGEVGSGKTTVAAFALWVAARQKSPAVLVCPTKILAQQHFQTLLRIFSLDKNGPTVGLITGKEKDAAADILIGTHALFNMKGLKPSLVVIDEEHRFGVKQRETFFQLKKKPHFLSMTATPIPRTVALTALADQDVSFIVPHKSNDNIKTWVTPHAKRTDAYAWITKTLQETKGQAIIVCPFIEESYIETLSAVKSAKKEFESLKKIFTSFKLALLHGRIEEKEKAKVFDNIMTGKTDILVTTPVVEVGVDIAGANIIVVEGAERYGLAGLHQLRGRVGRRGQAAYCLLFTSNETDGVKRLEYFAKTYDGNALAEYDLKHRGSGELIGIRQHGFDSLRFASWSDLKLIEECKEEVETYIIKKKELTYANKT